MGEGAAGRVDGLRVPLDEPRRPPSRPDEGPYGQLVGVGGARRAQAGPRGDERREARVGAEPLVDRVRVAVQVEQSPQASARRSSDRAGR